MNNNDNLFNTVVNDIQPEPPAKGLALAGMILGIASLAVPVLDWFLTEVSLPGSLAMAIVGIVLSSIAKKRGNNTGIRKAGTVTSIIGTALNGALTAAFCAMCGMTGCAVCAGVMAGM